MLKLLSTYYGSNPRSTWDAFLRQLRCDLQCKLRLMKLRGVVLQRLLLQGWNRVGRYSIVSERRRWNHDCR